MPVELISPLVNKLPPVILPNPDTVPPVIILPAVAVPVALTCPLVNKLPPITLLVALMATLVVQAFAAVLYCQYVNALPAGPTASPALLIFAYVV